MTDDEALAVYQDIVRDMTTKQASMLTLCLVSTLLAQYPVAARGAKFTAWVDMMRTHAVDCEVLPQ